MLLTHICLGVFGGKARAGKEDSKSILAGSLFFPNEKTHARGMTGVCVWGPEGGGRQKTQERGEEKTQLPLTMAKGSKTGTKMTGRKKRTQKANDEMGWSRGRMASRRRGLFEGHVLVRIKVGLGGLGLGGKAFFLGSFEREVKGPGSVAKCAKDSKKRRTEKGRGGENIKGNIPTRDAGAAEGIIKKRGK